MRNQGNIDGDSLYFHVLNMGPNWEIENILRGSYRVLPPLYSNRHKDFQDGTTGEWRNRLDMQVPPNIEEKRHTHYDDIIKVFLTTQSTSFILLELSEIGKNLERKEKSRTRGDGSGLLSNDWVALNFRIRSKVK